jgi:hypothetical protein
LHGGRETCSIALFTRRDVGRGLSHVARDDQLPANVQVVNKAKAMIIR